MTEAFVRAQREQKVLVTSDGAEVEQELVECGAGIDAIAVERRRLPDPLATRARTAAQRRRRAGSTSRGSALEREAPRVGEQAAALLRADVCPRA